MSGSWLKKISRTPLRVHPPLLAISRLDELADHRHFERPHQIGHEDEAVLQQGQQRGWSGPGSRRRSGGPSPAPASGSARPESRCAAARVSGSAFIRVAVLDLDIDFTACASRIIPPSRGRNRVGAGKPRTQTISAAAYHHRPQLAFSVRQLAVPAAISLIFFGDLLCAGQKRSPGASSARSIFPQQCRIQHVVGIITLDSVSGNRYCLKSRLGLSNLDRSRHGKAILIVLGCLRVGFES